MFEVDVVKKLQGRRKALESVLSSDELEKAKAAYAKAAAAEEEHVRPTGERRWRSWSDHTDTAKPEYIEGQRLYEVKNAAGLEVQRLEREYEAARQELAKVAPMLDAAGSIKTAKRGYADAQVAFRDLSDTVASHTQLIEELPREIETLEKRRRDLIGGHAKAEATARAGKQPVPAFPEDVARTETAIESKQATLAAAKEMLEQAKEALAPARQSIDQARANLRHALHAKAQLEFIVKTADLGAVAAMLIATASDFSELSREQKAELQPTAEELAAAHAAVAKEFA
jgi:hypothetical protein